MWRTTLYESDWECGVGRHWRLLGTNTPLLRPLGAPVKKVCRVPIKC